MPKLKRDDVEIHYESIGEGPLVLLSHGFGATSAMWRGQQPALSPRYRMVAWDLRGHGQTQSPEDPAAYSPEACVADTEALLDEAGVEQAVVGGHSLGGYLSLAFADRYPERVRALLLVGTGPGFKRDEPRQKWNANATKQAEKLEAKGLDALPRGQSEWAGTHHSASALARAARGMLAQSDAQVYEALARVRVPTLVLVGAEDRAFLAAADVMEGKIAGATKVVISDAGHAVNVDQPEAVNRALRDFLDSL